MSKGLLIVVSGPSGTGKGTVCSELLSQAQDLAYSISATTRQPRAGEVDGKNYYFMDKADFEKKIAEGGFLEYANVYGNYYGTPLGKIEERLAEGVDILLEIDTQGAINVMEKCPEGLFIFLVPPSLAELERRIRGRGSETEESLQKRMGSARKEIEDDKKYGYVVVNDTVKNAVQRIMAIRTAEHCRMDKNQEIFEELAK